MIFLMNFMISGMEKKFILSDLSCKEILPIICDKTSLEDTIKTVLPLSVTSKYFNTILSSFKVGEFCKTYDNTEKNKVAEKLLQGMYSNAMYWSRRRARFILAYAGVGQCYISFLEQATQQNDRQMVFALLIGDQ
jgi:hypothetical protein